MKCVNCQKKISFLGNYGSDNEPICYACSKISSGGSTKKMFKPVKLENGKETSFFDKFNNAFIEPKCELNDNERAWVEKSFVWFMEIFGTEAVSKIRMALPTREFFPDPYSPHIDSIKDLLGRIGKILNLDVSTIKTEIYQDNQQNILTGIPSFSLHWAGAAGTYGETAASGNAVISLSESVIHDQEKTIATIVHELSHFILLGGNKLTGDEKDMEPLTDLFTIFLGFGIFTANSIFKMVQWESGGSSGWSASRQGYLDEFLTGYGLACFAYLRDERFPSWHKYLCTNVKKYFKENYLYIYNNSNLLKRNIV